MEVRSTNGSVTATERRDPETFAIIGAAMEKREPRFNQG